MLILRIGLLLLVLVCLDSDKGVFRTYMQKFFKVHFQFL